MVCKKCGTDCGENTGFCPTCGAALTEQVVPEQPTVQPQQPDMPIYQPPYPQEAPAAQGKGLAVASLILGIVSFFCFAIITGILAIVFGSIAKSKGYRGGLATGGIVCGIIGVALWLLMIIFMPTAIFGLFGL